MNKQITVDADFVLEAYKEACSKWQKKIEDKFPDLFPKLTMTDIIEKLGRACYFEEVVIEDKYLILRRPDANSDWDLANFAYITDAYKEYPGCYVDWSKSANTRHIYINFDYKNF